ncbi:MAG TPA: hypothetical protein VJB10_04345 [Candidatus Peribacteraceae bacterium]|nr:hypothetical protein [Candidatus Peribacteraceae bacterium]
MNAQMLVLVVLVIAALVMVAGLIGLAFHSGHRWQWTQTLLIGGIVFLAVGHLWAQFDSVADWINSENAGSKYPISRDISRYLEWQGDAVHRRTDPAALEPSLGWAIYVGNHKEGRGSRAVEPGQPFPVEAGDNDVWYWFQQDREHQDGKRRNPTPPREFTR